MSPHGNTWSYGESSKMVTVRVIEGSLTNTKFNFRYTQLGTFTRIECVYNQAVHMKVSMGERLDAKVAAEKTGNMGTERHKSLFQNRPWTSNSSASMHSSG